LGCDGDPLVAVLAAQGCDVLATDPDVDRIAGDRLNRRGVCDTDAFTRRVRVRGLDMRAVGGDLRDFDFVWSCGGPERLGTCTAALDAIAQSLRCLRPGGLAVHTTTFNLSSNEQTLESAGLCALRRQDVERLVDEASRNGHAVWPLNFNPGAAPADRFVDTPPYRGEPHLRVRHGRFAVTSLGIAMVARSTATDRPAAT
jgi:SAM-dependent methyltransferase